MTSPGRGNGSLPATVTLREALEREEARPRFSTGSSGLDRMLGGGFKAGELVEVFGASGTGKTQLGLQTALSVAYAGHTCAYVDTEGQFRPERLSSISIARGQDPSTVLELVYCIRCESSSQQAEATAIVNAKEDLRDCRMIIVDTLTRNFSLDYSGQRLVTSRQAALGAYLNRLARDACLHDRAVLLLNRVASVTVDGRDAEVDIGGQTLERFVQKAVHLQRTGENILASAVGGTSHDDIRLRITERGLE